MGVFSGRGCGNSNISVKALNDYADSYIALVKKLEEHLSDNVSKDEDVHGVLSYVSKIKNDILEIVKTKADTEDIGNVGTLNDLGNTLVAATLKLKTLLDSKADTSALDDVARTSDLQHLAKTSDLQSFAKTKDVEALDTEVKASIAQLDASIKALDDVITDFAQRALLTSKGIVNFTEFTKVPAYYAGTGSATSTNTNGVYIIGQLSTSAFNNFVTPNKYQSSTVYLKFVNNSDFDATLNVNITWSNNGEHTGAIQATISRTNTDLEELAFHLVKGTLVDSDATAVYLAVSAKGLSHVLNGQTIDKTMSDYAEYTKELNFYVAGINIYPVGSANFKYPNGLVHDVCTVRIPNTLKQGTVTRDLSATTLTTDKLTITEVYDTDNNLLFSVTKDLEADTTTAVVHNQTVYAKIPSVTMTDGSIVPVALSNTLPVGSIIRWAAPEDKTPPAFMPCDGRQLTVSDYPTLGALFAVEGNEYFNLPVEDFSVIKVKEVV